MCMYKWGTEELWKHMRSIYTIFKLLSTFQAVQTGSDLETVPQDVNGTKLKAEDVLSEAAALLTATQGQNILMCFQNVRKAT